MTEFRRTLVLAAAIELIAAVGTASAQTVIVTKAAAGSTAEVWMNSSRVAAQAAGADGIATMELKLPARPRQTDELDVRVAVDSCGNVIRIQFVEAGLQFPGAGADCNRNELNGLFVMRPVTTFVFEATSPTMWLTQGPAPKGWLTGEVEEGSGITAPVGLVISLGGGLSFFSNAVSVACGDAPTCDSRGTPGTLSAGATVWLTPYLGGDVEFIKPADVTAAGSGPTSTDANSNYTFNSKFQSSIATVGAKVGFAFGRGRIYGLGGGAYHWASSVTIENIPDTTVTVNGVTVTVPGGTQRGGINGPGWGWMFGGGFEVWAKPKLGFFFDGIYAPIRGSDTSGGQGKIDDRIIYIAAGIRFNLWAGAHQ